MRRMLLFSLVILFLVSGISFAQHIKIGGTGNEVRVQIDDGACIEFKMEVKEHKVTLSNGQTVTQSVAEYKYWRPCGDKKWNKYEKTDASLLRKKPTTSIIRIPKKKYL